MLEDAAERENVLLGRVELAGDEEEAAERDEDVATPGPGPLSVTQIRLSLFDGGD